MGGWASARGAGVIRIPLCRGCRFVFENAVTVPEDLKRFAVPEVMGRRRWWW